MKRKLQVMAEAVELIFESRRESVRDNYIAQNGKARSTWYLLKA